MGDVNVLNTMKPAMQQQTATTMKLQMLLESAAKSCLNFLTEEDFVANYKKIFTEHKPIDPDAPPRLAGSSVEAKKLQMIIHDHVIESLREQIIDVINDNNLDAKFRELDQWKTRGGLDKKKKAWHPPGDAHEHIQPFDIAARLKEKNLLQQLVTKKEEHVIGLETRLVNLRNRVGALGQQLDSKLNDFETAMTTPVEDLQNLQLNE